MGHRCCSKQKVKRGLWSPEEDDKLLKHITTHGHGSWSAVPKLAGLHRCGKSCRLRWINYLRPDLKRGSFTEEEEQIIIDVHRILGNKWAQIAKHLPGRTDNEVKNFWNSCIKKKLMSQGLDPKTHNLIPSHQRASNKFAQTYHQPISVNFMSTVNGEMTSNVSMENFRPPVVLPIPIPASEYEQNPNFIWNANHCGQNSHDSISSISSTVNPTDQFGILDENYCFWGSNSNSTINIEPFEAPSMDQRQIMHGQEQQEKEKTCEMQIDETNFSGRDMDSLIFDSSVFDLENMVESTMMSSTMCRDLSSIDDISWNF